MGHVFNGRRVVFAAGAMVAAAGAACAGGIDWINAAGGMWGVDGNWSAGLPESLDAVNFHLAGAYTVTLDGDYDTREVSLRHGDVTFDLGGFTHTTNVGPGEWPITSLIIGDIAGQSNATFLNGTLAHTRIWMGGRPQVFPAILDTSFDVEFGAGAALTADHIMLMGTDFGRLTFRDGATAEFVQGIFSAGFGGTYHNEVLITGAGTTVSGTTFTFGESGTVDLTVSDGATLSATNSMYFAEQAGSVATVTIDHATLTTSSFGDFLGTDSELTVDVRNGGSLTTGSHTRFGWGMATATVSGVGSEWLMNGGTTAIGYAGAGVVDIEDGARLRTTLTLTVGQIEGSNGELNLRGVAAGTEAGGGTPTSAFLRGAVIGDSGAGVVRVTDGALAEMGLTIRIGAQETGEGRVEVSGAGTMWADALGAAVQTIVGDAGHGVFEVWDQGTMRQLNDDFVVGAQDGSLGEVRASGVGTTFEIGNSFGPSVGGILTVGASGMGIVTVTQGASMYVDALTIGEGATGDGLVEVGRDSTLTVRWHDLVVGAPGQGVVDIHAGGCVDVMTGSVVVGVNGKVTGDGKLTTASLDNSGTVRAGGGEGPLEIGGDYVQRMEGTFEYAFGGDERGDGFDGMLVMGDAALAGTLMILLDDGAEPAPGVYDLIRAASIVSTFDVEVFPGAARGLAYEVEYLDDAVRLRVVPGPSVGAAFLAGAGIAARRRRPVLGA